MVGYVSNKTGCARIRFWMNWDKMLVCLGNKILGYFRNEMLGCSRN